ncbi:hypothetical protein EYF80_002255 [Liparis tanakae]|uniref:Uncharacterized protein n=1 Tax=Liparis tanakae TaxID=230148 RepID=A0A4Z2JD15_9TELE|nr:hypothetical protein EYF80_002255 [Liparis tanakae]
MRLRLRQSPEPQSRTKRYWKSQGDDQGPRARLTRQPTRQQDWPRGFLASASSAAAGRSRESGRQNVHKTAIGFDYTCVDGCFTDAGALWGEHSSCTYQERCCQDSLKMASLVWWAEERRVWMLVFWEQAV